MSIKVYAFKTELKGTGENTRAVDWVNIGPVGLIMNNTTWFRIKDIMPPEDPLERDATGTQMAVLMARWSVVGPAYDAWKKGYELPEIGTAISMWPGVQKEIIDVFIKAGIKSIEGVAELGEASFAKVNVPDIRAYVKRAKEFLANKAGTDTTHRMDDLQKQNDDLAAKLEAAMEMLEAQVERKGGKIKEAA